MKQYLLQLLEACSEHQFGQDAIEWAIVCGHIPLTYHLDTDTRAVMEHYDAIIEGYRKACNAAGPLIDAMGHAFHLNAPSRRHDYCRPTADLPGTTG